jgi:regulator of replication initiation timing
VKGDDTLKAELAKAIAECEHLREENARLKHRVGEARFDWEPLSKIDCYRIKPETILKSHR